MFSDISNIATPRGHSANIPGILRAGWIRSPNRFQILASTNIDKCDKLIANENANIQSLNNTFQGHPPQILETTPSSPTANEPPSDINQTNAAT